MLRSSRCWFLIASVFPLVFLLDASAQPIDPTAADLDRRVLTGAV